MVLNNIGLGNRVRVIALNVILNSMSVISW